MTHLEWFGHVKRRNRTENIRAVVEMKMEGKRTRGRPKLRWKDTVRRDLKAWNIREEWATDRERWKGLCKTRYPAQRDGGERWEKLMSYLGLGRHTERGHRQRLVLTEVNLILLSAHSETTANEMVHSYVLLCNHLFGAPPSVDCVMHM